VIILEMIALFAIKAVLHWLAYIFLTFSTIPVFVGCAVSFWFNDNRLQFFFLSTYDWV
jgi:hypothetical protein